MPDPVSPRRVFESLLQDLSDGRWNDLADLHALATSIGSAPPGP